MYLKNFAVYLVIIEKNEKLTKHKDVAATLQFYCEKTLIHGLNYLYEKTKCTNLSLAGAWL